MIFECCLSDLNSGALKELNHYFDQAEKGPLWTLANYMDFLLSHPALSSIVIAYDL
jgi:hypothetical protein